MLLSTAGLQILLASQGLAKVNNIRYLLNQVTHLCLVMCLDASNYELTVLVEFEGAFETTVVTIAPSCDSGKIFQKQAFCDLELPSATRKKLITGSSSCMQGIATSCHWRCNCKDVTTIGQCPPHTLPPPVLDPGPYWAAGLLGHCGGEVACGLLGLASPGPGERMREGPDVPCPQREVRHPPGEAARGPGLAGRYGDNDRIVDLDPGVFPEITMNKDSQSNFPKYELAHWILYWISSSIFTL
ncbi:hypothetical protein Y1Q_0021999 [Alligator mississippiensis]|uniref:Uncharacterized protein n=1 Tax=Alligator mississippiensis TaxID=8496 RepID=A0A151NLN1_ALLMI|nr:hypothetical protein Y1Q_0021999 [Alligator mississippiensis]